MTEPERPQPRPTDLAGYFLRLGATGFGGPVGLAHAMHRDLVLRRRWLTEAEYDEGLAIAAACPGPLAYQLAVYCGFVRLGIGGAVAVAAAFALAPFLFVLAAAALYVRFAGTWPVRALFAGVAPVVVALIVRATVRLGKRTLRPEPFGWALFLAAFAVTAVLQRELVAVFPLAGLAGAWRFGRGGAPARRNDATPARAPALALLPLAGTGAAATAPTGLFLFFFKTGLLIFGSGLVIVPFLKTYVVDRFHWLGDRAFLDAVAIGMISPGPVVISATFVGFLVAGFAGAAAATVGIFSPAVLFTVVATPILRRHASHPRLAGFLRGVTLAVVGVLAGTTWLVARGAITGAFSASLAAGSLAALLRFPRLPEPAIVGAGALLGLVAGSLSG